MYLTILQANRVILSETIKYELIFFIENQF